MARQPARKFSAIVIGASAGGVQALRILLGSLPANFPLPILIVQHIAGDSDGLARLLDGHCLLPVKEAEEQEVIQAGTVYLAPADYHLLVEKEAILTLSVDRPVNFSRPSIDVLFESAADVFVSELIGVVLTGANADGSVGLRRIKERGGIALVQDPADAEAKAMPMAALEATEVDYIMPLAAMAALLQRLALCPIIPAVVDQSQEPSLPCADTGQPAKPNS